MNEDQQHVLVRLYTAARNDQWELCRENTRELLLNVDPIDATRIIVKQARRFLDDFSHTHPEDQDIDKTVQSLSEVTSPTTFSEQAQRIDTLLQRYWAHPGVSNYRKGLKLASTLHQFGDFTSEYINTVVDTLSTIIVAIDTHNWAHLNLSLWNRMLEADDATVLSIAWSDPESIELRKSLWIEIAFDLGAALQTG